MKQSIITSGAQHILHNGYFSVQAQNSQFDKVIRCFLDAAKDFFSQTQEHKNIHVFSKEGYGYEYRGPENPNEYKETIHLYSRYHLPIGASDEDRRFVSIAKMLIQILKPTIRLVAEVVSQASGKDLVDFLVSSLSKATLRVIYYPPDIPGMQRDFLATEHIDKGFTTHLGETSQGLQIFWNGTWVDVAEVSGFVHGYAGMLGQYYTECALTALRHRVIPTEDSRIKGRYAVVLFLDPGDHRYDKVKWGKTQDTFGKGQNYGMSFSDFSKYIAPKSIATAV